jgi:hypothetical protein
MYTPDSQALQQRTTPSQFQGGSAEVILLGSDLLRDKPQYLMEYFRSYGEKPTFLQKVQSLGFSRAVQGPVTGHYEEPRPTHTFTIGAVVTAPSAPTAGKDIVVSVKSTDMVNYTTPAGQTVIGSRPRAGETFMLADHNEYYIRTKNEQVNPHQLTVRCVDQTVDPTLAVVANARAFIIGSVKGEATGQIKPLVQRHIKYENTFVIVDDTAFASGTYLTTASPFIPVKGKPGYFYTKDFRDVEVRHERSKSMRILFGKPFTGINDYSDPLGRDVPISGTEGFLYFAETYGFKDPYPTGAYSVADFDALSSYYEDRRVPSTDIVLFQGSALNRQLENTFKTYLDNTFVNYVADKYMGAKVKGTGMTASDMFISIGFSGIRKGSFNYIFTPMDEFNDIEGAGDPAFDYKQRQYAAPVGLLNNKRSDPGTPLLGYEYRGVPGGYSRENEIWKTGGAGPIQKTSEFDVMSCYMRSEIAAHFSLGELFVTQVPQ